MLQDIQGFLENRFYTVARRYTQVLQRVQRFTKERYSREHSTLQRVLLRHVRHSRDVAVEIGEDWKDFAMLLVPVVGRMRMHQPGVQSLVFAGDTAQVRSITGQFRENLDHSAGVTLAELTPDGDSRSEEQTVAKGPDVIVCTPARLIDHIRRGNVRLNSVSTCVVVAPASELSESFAADLHFIFAKMTRPQSIVFARNLTTDVDSLSDLLRRPQMISRDDWANHGSPRFSKNQTKGRDTMPDQPFDEDVLKSTIKAIIRKVHEDEDPIELTAYKKFLRRNTSIFNRAYVGAYLLKYAQQPSGIRGRSERPTGRRGAKTRSPEPTVAVQKEVQSDSNTVSVFVSIGCSRRVHSRDLVTLFTTTGGLTNDDHGQIKVLDNYSFVEVATDKAQAAIDELNGKELRGRALTVNFARRK
ncbi:MAG: DEAD/DEAH box helicase [Spirochaetales bacterium]|nr:MAG: DEAD/DEAH box helicase [Spirochaetales bacterium]